MHSSASAPRMASTLRPIRNVALDERADVHELREVAAHDLPYLLVRKTGEGQGVAGGIRQPFGVRVVRPEKHVLLTDHLGESAQVVLPEGTDVDVALEDGDRVLEKVLRHLLVDVGQILEQRLHPDAAILDDRDLELGEARQRAMTDER